MRSNLRDHSHFKSIKLALMQGHFGTQVTSCTKDKILCSRHLAVLCRSQERSGRILDIPESTINYRIRWLRDSRQQMKHDVWRIGVAIMFRVDGCLPRRSRQSNGPASSSKKMTNPRVPLKQSDGRAQLQNPYDTNSFFISARDSSHI